MKKSMALLGALCSLVLILACTGCEQPASGGGNGGSGGGSGNNGGGGENPPPPPPSHVIGDIGPAGGYVFYDKGSNSDGWRYLEMAPSSLGTFEWGAYEKDVVGTKTEIGSGKNNTDLIVAYLNSINETGKAAQAAATYSYGGKTDWFLPSKDELNEMYEARVMIGGFANDDIVYWSSSQKYTDYAWNQLLYHGGRNYFPKCNANGVRVVRAF